VSADELERVCSEVLGEPARDIRNPPDEPRRRQFKAGWLDATDRRRDYTARTLECLTWRNLGYRMGRACGHARLDEIQAAYDRLVQLYYQRSGA
jgi:hypothetical protein